MVTSKCQPADIQSAVNRTLFRDHGPIGDRFRTFAVTKEVIRAARTQDAGINCYHSQSLDGHGKPPVTPLSTPSSTPPATRPGMLPTVSVGQSDLLSRRAACRTSRRSWTWICSGISEAAARKVQCGSCNERGIRAPTTRVLFDERAAKVVLTFLRETKIGQFVTNPPKRRRLLRTGEVRIWRRARAPLPRTRYFSFVFLFLFWCVFSLGDETGGGCKGGPALAA